MPGKHNVRVTRAAEDDATEIHDHIARDSPRAALEWLGELERQVASLERFPLRFPVIPEARDLGVEYRHLVYGNYRTVYRVEGSTVWIVRIVHGARLLDTSLLEGEGGRGLIAP